MKRTVGNNDWLDIDVLDDYLEGRLDASTMHKVERVSLEDPFVAQALAGLTEAKKRTQSLSFLQKQLQERVAEKPVERKRWQLTSHRLSIAATAAVLFITVGVLFMMRESNRRELEQLAAAKRAKGIEVNLEPKVAAAAPVDTLANTGNANKVLDKKVAQALGNVLAKRNSMVAKNNSADKASYFDSLEQRTTSAALKKSTFTQQTMIGVPTVAPVSPVQALDGRVSGIQAKTDPNLKSLKGTVYDVYGRPISGADVKMVGDDIRAITNRSGEFTLPVGKDLSEKVTIEVASLGFARKNIEAKVNEPLKVSLDEDAHVLREVVAVSDSEKSKKAVKNAFGAPKIGWKAYEEYLRKENKLFTTGSQIVVLSFSISADGSPVDIKVDKSVGKLQDEEAIRLLTSGSKWSPSSVTDYRGVLSVKF
ncbi:carboxypeptidase-like regulatory domain-containing protein [Nubsella zeaxanthinifaciens]|uniref:carboxypeptidase-like regulatory domain-containing protein n=1 Tax=Nubsella zeaxanthinifaciens TaxID=392412 RepID=UPI003D0387A7